MSPRGARRGAWVLALVLAVALTAWALASARDLEIVTRLEEFLPDGAVAADDYRLFLSTFGGFERIHAMVLWRGPEPDTVVLAAAADHVAERLRRLPEVAAARAGLEAEDEDFLFQRLLPRAPLFAGDDERAAARLAPAAIERRVAELRRDLLTPAGAARGRWRAADPLGFAGEPGTALLSGVGLAGALDPWTGAILSPSGDAALLSITPAVGELDTAAGRLLAAGLAEARAGLVEAFPGAPLELVALGGPLYAVEDESLIRTDLRRTIAGSAIAVTLLLVLFYGGVGIPLALVCSVAAGVVWTAGWVAADVGEVSVLGVSFVAMLLGLGVDYGIHGASRFRSERLASRPPGFAVSTAMRQTGPAILASVTTTVAAFLVLSLARFRPVEELGRVMTVGILAILLATVAVGGSLLALLGGLGKQSGPVSTDRGSGPWRWIGSLTEAMIGLGRRRSRAVLAVALVVTVAAIAGLARLRVSLDLRALRPENHSAFEAERLLSERFALGLDGFTVVIRGRDLDEALTRASRAQDFLGPRLPAGATAASPTAWLPAGDRVAARLEVIGGEPAAGAAAALRRALAAEGLRVEAFGAALEVLDAAARREPPPPIPPSAWPDSLGELIRFSEDRSVFVALRAAIPLGSWPEGPPDELVEELREAVPETVVASVPRVGAELRRTVMSDFSRLDFWALATVAAVVLIFFRGRPRPAVLALLPVTLGGLWTLGLAGLLGVPLDPFGIVVAPLILGIGIDDGLHALVGARVHGGLLASLRENGRAMAVTTLTTCAGFASLLGSSVPSLRRGGLLVATGAICCLVVTLVLLPALERVGAVGEKAS